MEFLEFEKFFEKKQTRWIFNQVLFDRLKTFEWKFGRSDCYRSNGIRKVSISVFANLKVFFVTFGRLDSDAKNQKAQLFNATDSKSKKLCPRAWMTDVKPLDIEKDDFEYRELSKISTLLAFSENQYIDASENNSYFSIG